MDKVFYDIDSKKINDFKKSIIDVLNIYLIESATNQGLIDKRIKEQLIRNI